MTILPFQGVFPEIDYIASSQSFFSSVKEEYPSYRSSGFFRKNSREALYPYRITNGDRQHLGLIACTPVKEYTDGNILRHEHTLAAKEQQQMQLLLQRNATVKPVLLVHPPQPELHNWLDTFMHNNKPILVIEFEESKDRHEVWEVSDGADIQALQNRFKEHIQRTYIADGHHRTATAALLNHRRPAAAAGKGYDQLMCAIFPTTDVAILDFNRVVDYTDACTPTRLMAQLSRYFEITAIEKGQLPTRKHEISMLLEKEWYLLHWRDHVLKAQEESLILDADLLNRYVFEPILDIDNVRTDQRIQYVEGPKGLKGLTKKCIKTPGTVAFGLYPIPFSDLKAIVDAGGVMPPKSTWFEPRMRNGLVVQEY